METLTQFNTPALPALHCEIRKTSRDGAFLLLFFFTHIGEIFSHFLYKAKCIDHVGERVLGKYLCLFIERGAPRTQITVTNNRNHVDFILENFLYTHNFLTNRGVCIHSTGSEALIPLCRQEDKLDIYTALQTRKLVTVQVNVLGFTHEVNKLVITL